MSTPIAPAGARSPGSSEPAAEQARSAGGWPGRTGRAARTPARTPASPAAARAPSRAAAAGEVPERHEHRQRPAQQQRAGADPDTEQHAAAQRRGGSRCEMWSNASTPPRKLSGQRDQRTGDREGDEDADDGPARRSAVPVAACVGHPIGSVPADLEHQRDGVGEQRARAFAVDRVLASRSAQLAMCSGGGTSGLAANSLLGDDLLLAGGRREVLHQRARPSARCFEPVTTPTPERFACARRRRPGRARPGPRGSPACP